MAGALGNSRSRLIGAIATFILSCIGGTVFYFVHLPLPWMLGPIAAVLIGSRFVKVKLYWPVGMRNVGLVIIGYMLGSSITLETLSQMAGQLPSMLLVTVLTLLFSGGFAYLMTKLTGISFRSTLAGSIPGGLSQMIVLGEEIKGIDLTVVTFFQITRLMSVIFIVPLLVLSPLFAKGNGGGAGVATAQSTGSGWSLSSVLIFAIVAVLAAFIGSKIKLPTAFLLGPIIGTAVLVISGVHAPALPKLVIDFSQILMGAYIGLMIKPSQLTNKAKTTGIAIATGLALLVFSFILASLLKLMHGLPYITAFLSMAPGGMAQMGIVAKEADANLSIITGYQMFRIFFILFVVPPAIKWVLTREWIDKIGSHRRAKS